MKELRKIELLPAKISKQLKAFKSLLASKSSLGERELLDFFKNNDQLVPSMSSDVVPQLTHYDYIAREYDLFGDFTCDFVIGNRESRQPIYCVVEFEDARPESIFKNKPGKHTSEWSPRFEQGFFQLVDWFHQLDDLKPTTLFRNKFGENPEFYGLLVIGRNQFLNDSERRRLNWCSGKILINSCKIYCKTFDDLYDDMAYKYRVFADQVAFLKAV